MTLSMTGYDKLQMKFKELSGIENKAAGRAAINAGLQELVKAYRMSSPVGKTVVRRKQQFKSTGIAVQKASMRESVGKRFNRTRKGRRSAGGVAGFNVGKKSSGRAPHAHLATLGTAQRYTKSGAYRGSVPPNAKTSAAANAAVPRALQAMERKLKEYLAKQASR